MTTTKRKHISHAAKAARLRVRDVSAVYEYETNNATKKETVAKIRDAAKCTYIEANRLFDLAIPIVRQIRKDEASGGSRRRLAERKPPLTVEQRKTRAIRGLLRGLNLPGSHYSGDTKWRITATDRAQVGASTTTGYGDQYSRRCTFHKTDATHHLRICLGDLVAARRTPVPAEVDGELVVRAQQVREGVYQATTLATSNKQCEARTRYIADQGQGRWYLGKTERGAVVALNRSARMAEAERLGQVNSAVCASWGWCATGILQWCQRHGITRNLRARLRRGTSSEAIGRLIEKHGGASNAYERRLLAAAGRQVVDDLQPLTAG